MEFFDVEALIRAVLISIGAGLVVGAIVFGITASDRRRKRRRILIMSLIGVIMLACVGIYYAWPSLSTVPSLQGLSQAQAEDLLIDKGLIPESRSQYSSEAATGIVIPGSQDPPPGLAVRKGSHVSFAINAQRGNDSAPSGGLEDDLMVSLFQPESGGRFYCTRGATGIYTSTVKGSSSGVSLDQHRLLLWIKPVDPPSDRPGWYLQRPPVGGIPSIEQDGSWSGVAQIGNALWPPRDGHIFDVAVSVADIEIANRVLGGDGEVMRIEPIGLRSSIARGVIVVLQE